MPVTPDPTIPTDNPPSGKAAGTYGQKDVGRAARSTDAMTTRAGETPSKVAGGTQAAPQPRSTHP